MSEPPGLPSGLGIESVECIPEGGSLTVRVTGRWRRRRPEWRGPAILVVEAQGTRYRFPAMPEPPSLSGTMPGTWRMSFSVARELGPHLAGRSWLQLGSLVAPLPVFAETKVTGPGSGAPTVEDAPASEPQRPRRTPGALAIDTARRRADEAESLAAELALRVDQLERALEEARAQPARLERARRAAEQGAHAETARRAELEEQLAEQERALEEARSRASALARRVEELELELRRLRRTADEAVHLAAGERAARLRAERLALERQALEPKPPALEPHPVHADALAERLSEERRRALESEQRQVKLAVARSAPPAVGSPVALSAPEVRAIRGEIQMRAGRAAPAAAGELLQALLDRERARRAEAEHRVAALERTLTERTNRWARAYAEIDLIRDEIGELRRVFAHIEATTPASPDPAGPVQPARLSDALARLREQAEVQDEAQTSTPAPQTSAPSPERSAPAPTEPRTLAVPPARSPRDRYAPLPGGTGRQSVPPPGSDPAAPVEPGPWLWPIFRRLAGDDALFAGQLLLALLPAWPRTHPLPVAFDLVLGDRASIQVTVGGGSVEVSHAEAPRRPEDVHFQVRGDLERLARTVAAGRVRRRLGRRMARISGEQEAFSRLGLLVRSPITLAELHEAGVRLDPDVALRLVSLMIEPAWTVGERFTIAHQIPGAETADAHLVVRDGAPVSASDGPPAGMADTTIVSSAQELLATLGGRAGTDVRVQGRQESLALLAGWLDRAQSA